jgi:hypothetical protein
MLVLIAHASIEWIICSLNTNFIHIFFQHCHVKNANNIWIWHLEVIRHVCANLNMWCQTNKLWFDTWKLIRQAFIKLLMWMSNGHPFCICDIFPKGNFHFQINMGTRLAITFNSLNSQLPEFLIRVNQLLETNNPIVVLKSFLKIYDAIDLNLLEAPLPRL